MTSLPKTLRTIARERTPMPEQRVEARVQNFSEVALGYGVEEARREAERCLDCRDARCLRGCPVAVDIPTFLRKVTQRDYRGAYDVLARSNVLPAICGRVCPQEDQCEGVCTVGDALEPVAIGRLERFVGDLAIDQGWASAAVAEKTGLRVGIVGSGPAGIACAADLARLGCEVTIYDALHAPGGVLRYGIPEFRLPKRIVDAEIESLRRLGVQIECNTLVGRLFTIEQMIEELGFHAVFIATGAGLPKFMRIPGEGLNGVVSANELLTRCNLMQAGRFPEFDTPLGLGKRVAVIGAGNTAMDALRVALRSGAEEVLCVYRRSRGECPARAEELHHAEQEGVRFHWLTQPVAIVDDDRGNVRALRCVRMALGEPDASGRRRPEPVEGSEFELPVDMVIYAIGTHANPIIGQTSKIALNRWGYIETDAQLATSLAGVYAGGDIVTGSATVILAMGAGRRAAQSIARYLGLHASTADARDGLFGVPEDQHAFLRLREAAWADVDEATLVPAVLAPLRTMAALRPLAPLRGTRVSCSRAGAQELLTALRTEVDARRSEPWRQELRRLSQALTELSQLDFMTMESAWSATQLAASLGPCERDDFDLEALSTLLTRRHATREAAPPRLSRIRALQDKLASARVLALPEHAWIFASCAEALAALPARLAEVAGLLDAIAHARLDCREHVPDDAAARFTREDALALLPPSLVHVDADRLDGMDLAQLVALLSSGLPVMVLCTSARLDALPRASGLYASCELVGGPAALVAALARGLGHVHVVQTALSHLPQVLSHVERAWSSRGAALVAVYTGEEAGALPPLLASAAARAARLFPSFRFDPEQQTLSLDDDAAPGETFPLARFSFEREALARVLEDEAFTAAHLFAMRPEGRAPSSEQATAAVPMADALADPRACASAYVSMSDAEGRLVRVRVSASALSSTRRVAAHYERLVRLASRSATDAVHAEPPHSKPQSADASAELSEPSTTGEPDAPSGAYIETARCSSCDECVRANGRMFAYDADKRAVLRDVHAGSYRELVEAAERCQMAIIHPGEPWNASEPGLDALQKRAAALF